MPESKSNKLSIVFDRYFTDYEMNVMSKVLIDYAQNHYDAKSIVVENINEVTESFDYRVRNLECKDNFFINRFTQMIVDAYKNPFAYYGQTFIDLDRFFDAETFLGYINGFLYCARAIQTEESKHFVQFYGLFEEWVLKQLDYSKYHDVLYIKGAYNAYTFVASRCGGDFIASLKKYCELYQFFLMNYQNGDISKNIPLDYPFYLHDFYKYQATGNDFIIIPKYDNLKPLEEATISNLCDRHKGIGADGFILFDYSISYDFEMIYHNADGKVGSMCGNGGRAILHFYFNQVKPEAKTVRFQVNGATYHGSLHEKGYALRMTEPTAVQLLEEGVYFTDTGSPHVVILVESAEKLNDESHFRTITHKYRYDSRFEAGGGTNVNLLFRSDEGLQMRTFERGVEDETLSCGTGTVAVTAVMRHLGMMNDLFTIETKGGTLYVEWDGNIPTLIGPAVCVFTGKLSL